MISEVNNDTTKIMPWVIIAVIACIIGVWLFGNGKNENGTEKEAQTESAKLYEAFKKCAVMEAVDIYETGNSSKTDNIFNEGRDFCNDNYKNIYQKDEKKFIDDISSSWESRKAEVIEDKTLDYYLNSLNW